MSGQSVSAEHLLVVVGTGPQLYREYLLASLSTRHRIHLLSAIEPGWESPYLDDASVVPLDGPGAVTAALRELVGRRPVAGVLTWVEAHVVETAAAAEAVGLPGPGRAAAVRCRDKSATRAALAAHGVPQPVSRLVGHLDQARAAADELGYPVVLKPRAGVASEGVVLVHDAVELAEHFATTGATPAEDLPAADDAVLVEEYLDGPEISVDTAVHHGRPTPVHVARKEIGFAPFFEEIGHTVSGCDPLLRDPALLRVLEGTHAALGYRDGTTHTELKITADGPKVIEVNGRLGGDLIPYLGSRASGTDAGLAAAAVACGEPPQVGSPLDATAGIRFFYPPWPGAIVRSVDFDRTDLPAETDLLLPLVAPGEVISPPGKGLMDGRVALATAVGGSAASCLAALDHAAAALRCSWASRDGS